MTDGHLHIPPPEFDPRRVDDLRRITEQNHRNAVGQTHGLGWVLRGVSVVPSWPVRVVIRRLRTKPGDEPVA